MAPGWSELFARAWAVARVALRLKRKAYRRVIRRWRYRHGVTLHSRDRAYEASLTLQPGACIPVPTRQQPALFHVPNNALANELTKELYVKGIAMRQRDEEELDDNAFIFPCHRGLN